MRGEKERKSGVFRAQNLSSIAKNKVSGDEDGRKTRMICNEFVELRIACATKRVIFLLQIFQADYQRLEEKHKVPPGLSPKQREREREKREREREREKQRETDEGMANTRMEEAEEGLPAAGHLFSDDQKKQLLCGLNGTTTAR